MVMYIKILRLFVRVRACERDIYTHTNSIYEFVYVRAHVCIRETDIIIQKVVIKG